MNHRLGDFELLRPLGQGGMATVWLARHSAMGFEAAVKLVTSELANDRFMRAFESEARKHAALVHPAIAALHDFGHVGEDDDPPAEVEIGMPFLVMARAGSTLREQIDELDWPSLREILSDILDGLAFAHAHRVIHRDLKPENVLVFDHGVRHRLTDFGIAQPLTLERVTVEDLPNQTAGTPHYMPPEQLRGRVSSFGPWTDLYALGCLAYELVCGRCPFTGTTVIQIAHQHLESPVPRLVPRFPVPEGLGAWIDRLLIKDPFSRVARAADARHALLMLGDVSPSATSSTSRHLPADPTLADTIVDNFATDETLEATGEVLSLAGRNASGPADARRITAPFQEDWQGHSRSNERLHDYLGPGLFAMREPGQMGFERVRDALWRELGLVAREQTTKGLVLSGDPGAPTHGLAEWLATRSHELGAATDLRTFYTPAGGPYDGVPGLIAHGFHLVATEPTAMADAIAEQLGADDEVLQAQCDMLANEVRRARNALTRGSTARSAIQLFEAFTLLIEKLAADRPVIMWLDDVHHSQDGLAIVDHLLGRALPVLIVMTVSKSGLVENSAAARALDMVLDKTDVSSLEIAPYTESVQASLLDSLISLEDHTRDRIVATTRPDVVFMRALVAKLIDDDLLHFEGDSFRLLDDTMIPADATALYRTRLAEILRDFGKDGMVALITAAALGPAPTHDDWNAVAELQGVQISPDLISALTRKGLARASDRGISFVDDRAHRAVIEMAKDEGSWAKLNEACADHLASRENADGLILRRLAGHLWEAGQTRRALEVMSESLSKFVQTEPRLAMSFLELRQRWLDDASLPESSTLVIDQIYYAGTCDLSIGKTQSAEDQFRQVLDASTSIGYGLGIARAAMYLGHVCLARGKLDQAMPHLQSALSTFQSMGEDSKCGGVHLLLGYLAYASGDVRKTLLHYKQAHQAYERSSEMNRLIQAKVYLGHAYVMTGELDKAEKVVSEASRECRARGEYSLLADCLAVMAEIERFRGNFREARQFNAETAYWRRLNGRQAEVVTRFNDALVTLGQHDWAGAAHELEAILPMVEAGRHRQLEPLIQIALAAASLGSRNMQDFERHLRLGLALQEDKPDRDFAWTLKIAADFATRHKLEVAEELMELAKESHRRLGG